MSGYWKFSLAGEPCDPDRRPACHTTITRLISRVSNTKIVLLSRQATAVQLPKLPRIGLCVHATLKFCSRVSRSQRLQESFFAGPFFAGHCWVPSPCLSPSRREFWQGDFDNEAVTKDLLNSTPDTAFHVPCSIRSGNLPEGRVFTLTEFESDHRDGFESKTNEDSTNESAHDVIRQTICSDRNLFAIRDGRVDRRRRYC